MDTCVFALWKACHTTLLNFSTRRYSFGQWCVQCWKEQQWLSMTRLQSAWAWLTRCLICPNTPQSPLIQGETRRTGLSVEKKRCLGSTPAATWKKTSSTLDAVGRPWGSMAKRQSSEMESEDFGKFKETKLDAAFAASPQQNCSSNINLIT